MEKLPGDYIAGFVDGEGCFALKFRRDFKSHRKGKQEYFYWDIEFAVVQDAKDEEILKSIQNTLECGRISISKRGVARYSVNDIDDLVGKIIPFFETYKLHARKRFDFELWKRAITIFMKNQKTMWTEPDREYLKAIHGEMTKYKGGNKGNWKWL